MEIDLSLNAVFYLIGEATVIILASAVVVAFVLVIISLYSIRTGRLYFPQTLKAGLALFEGLMKAMFRLLGLEDREMLAFFIKIHNAMNKAAFERIPVAERAVFMPQCLRSSQCPANLTPEGLKCSACGQCTVGEARIASGKNGLPDLHRPRFIVHQADGEEISPESDHRRRLPCGSEGRYRYGRQDRACRDGRGYVKRGVRRDACQLAGCL